MSEAKKDLETVKWTDNTPVVIQVLFWGISVVGEFGPKAKLTIKPIILCSKYHKWS